MFCVQVVSAKVVARASFKNQRYGYITLSSPQQAQKSVLELNKTELKGRKITVEIVSVRMCVCVCVCVRTCVYARVCVYHC